MDALLESDAVLGRDAVLGPDAVLGVAYEVRGEPSPTSDGTLLRVRVTGELDDDTIRPVLGAALEAMDADLDHVAVELDQLWFLSCAGAGGLLRMKRAAEEHGATFSIERPTPMVLRLFDIVGLTRHLGVVPSVRA